MAYDLQPFLPYVLMVLLLICFELSGDKYEEINKGKKVTKDNIERKKVWKGVQVIHKQITGTKE